MVATRLQAATACDFPAPVAIGAVVQEDFVELPIIVQVWPVPSKFSQSRRYLVVGIVSQNRILIINLGGKMDS
jgi:hypothetical protein